ncbi:16S rRNA (guanine(527)-N(7))-methyltransferase RsmG, partial [Pseudomonas aeruginosa]|nr:16S rRNA (guanine(527)-N(7))-methyltransferase RsmG [Pseudomonas aeruginosa]
MAPAPQPAAFNVSAKDKAAALALTPVSRETEA